MSSKYKDFSCFISQTYSDFDIPIKELFDDKRGKSFGFDFFDFPYECVKYFRDNKKNINELQYDNIFGLLFSYEDLFKDRGLRDRYLAPYCQMYYCIHCLVPEIESRKPKCIKEEEKIDYKIFYQKKWLSICIESTTNHDIRSIFETRRIDPEEYVEAEEQVQSILFDNCSLRQEFKEEKQKPILEVVSDWYLQRYNLVSALRIIIKLIRMDKKASIKEILGAIWCVESLIIPITIFILCMFWFNHLTSITDGFFKAFNLRPSWNVDSLVTTILVGLYLIILIFILLLLTKGARLLKILIPRLIGGIIVGYLPLLLDKDPWSLAIRMMESEPILGFMMIFLAIISSVYYVFSEIYKTVRNRSVALCRAIRIYSMGLIESLLLGIMVLDIVTEPLYPELYGKADTVAGLFGYVNLGVLYVYFPVALFIGFFVQMMWSEKPITYPI